MKEAIERILVKLVKHGEGSWALIPISEAAAAIAVLVEDEKAIIETVWITKCVKLEARLAVLTKALEVLLRHGLSGDDEVRYRAYAQAEQALAAAGKGKGLWSGVATIHHWRFESSTILIPRIICNDGREVFVIIEEPQDAEVEEAAETDV